MGAGGRGGPSPPVGRGGRGRPPELGGATDLAEVGGGNEPPLELEASKWVALVGRHLHQWLMPRSVITTVASA